MTSGSVRPRVVLLGGQGVSTRIVHNALRPHVDELLVLVEDRVSRRSLLLHRARRLGWLTVLGQVLFVKIVVPLLRRSARSRIIEIKELYGLDDRPSVDFTRVDSANSTTARHLIDQFRPDVAIVNGTRILTPETLRTFKVPVLNTHAGITPRYRGVHGGYWALREKVPELVGTTVHVVDEGIDTGEIVGQATFDVTTRDNFTTYPYLHIAYGLPILLDSLQAASSGNLATFRRTDLKSRLRTHPTIWSYLLGRWKDGVR